MRNCSKKYTWKPVQKLSKADIVITEPALKKAMSLIADGARALSRSDELITTQTLTEEQ